MDTYHKIKTVFLRNPETKYKTLLNDQYALPEFEYLTNNKWIFTEKVDGTNIRVEWINSKGITFGGRTDNASIPVFLLNKLQNIFTEKLFQDNMPEEVNQICLYGEGFGAKIQKGGGNYISDGVGFVLFDVKVGDWWLKQVDVIEIAKQLKIQRIPIVGEGTLTDMVDFVKSGFTSQWGDFLAEGIVARPFIDLFARNGSRIITKIKHKDFNNV